MQLMPVLAPIHREYRIERINVATYQSVSGGGRSALEELGQQTAQLLAFQEINPQRFPVQIAFNLIPHIDDFQSNGYTKEEMKLVWETQKILEDSNIQVNPTAVRVPVFFGHSEAVNIETQRKSLRSRRVRCWPVRQVLKLSMSGSRVVIRPLSPTLPVKTRCLLVAFGRISRIHAA